MKEIPQEIRERKGARKVSEVPSEVLALIQQGKLPTVNLTEWLAVDFIALVENVFPDLGISEATNENIGKRLQVEKKLTAMLSTRLIGKTLFGELNPSEQVPPIFEKLAAHPSDCIRNFAPYLIAPDESLTLAQKLEKAQPFAADPHFGVREIVWMALRPEIEKQLETGISILADWASHEDENIRRFASEATRPRGVWCSHIETLKENPALALPILEPLKADESKYVQDSVGNWLNDSSKTAPDFVKGLCDRWKSTSPTKPTERIIKKALRSLNKKQ